MGVVICAQKDSKQIELTLGMNLIFKFEDFNFPFQVCNNNQEY